MAHPPPPPPPGRGGPPPPPKHVPLVNSTISQDRAHGATAIEEANLKALDKSLGYLSLKSNLKDVKNQSDSTSPPPVIAPVHISATRRRGRRSSSASSFASNSSQYSTSPPRRHKSNRTLPVNARNLIRKE